MRFNILSSFIFLFFLLAGASYFATAHENSAQIAIKQHGGTKEYCAAFWSARTAGWKNPPSEYRIYTDPAYCGNA